MSRPKAFRPPDPYARGNMPKSWVSVPELESEEIPKGLQVQTQFGAACSGHESYLSTSWQLRRMETGRSN